VKGLRYRDIAPRLKVSEATVKRYFNGRGIDLAVLQKLAEIVDHDLLSLVVSAHQKGETARELSEVQRSALKRSRILRSVLFSLVAAMTPAQIIDEFDVSK